MTDERLPDEKLDQEIENKTQDQDPLGPAPDPLQSDEGKKQEVDPEKVNQSKDEAIRNERKKRKEAEQREKDKQEKIDNLQKEIDNLQKEWEEKDNPSKPKRDYKKGESIREEHLEGKAERLLINFRLDNPNATELASVIKKILFKEKPFLLEKGKEGFDMAVEIAKGRVPQPEKKSAPLNQQTSTPQPGGKQQPEDLNPPPLTEKEEKEITTEELKRRENESIRKRREKLNI